jgi:hypothetical protein
MKAAEKAGPSAFFASLNVFIIKKLGPNVKHFKE